MFYHLNPWSKKWGPLHDSYVGWAFLASRCKARHRPEAETFKPTISSNTAPIFAYDKPPNLVQVSRQRNYTRAYLHSADF